MSDWQPDKAETLEEAVFQAIGTASVCWSETPKGVFQSDLAKSVGEGLIKWIQDAEARAHPMIVLEMAEEIYTREEADVEAPHSLEQDIAAVLNRHSAEGVSDTPDFILAGALVAALNAVDWAILRRGTWYGHHCSVDGGCSHE